MTKLPNLIERIKIIEAAIAKEEVQLEDAEGSQRDELERAIKRGQDLLMRLKQHMSD